VKNVAFGISATVCWTNGYSESASPTIRGRALSLSAEHRRSPARPPALHSYRLPFAAACRSRVAASINQDYLMLAFQRIDIAEVVPRVEGCQ
jgi:hypothetical protein